eukprot:COSAG02_NODE_523_length_20725_cov_1521.265781_7_plen_63_part_00
MRLNEDSRGKERNLPKVSYNSLSFDCFRKSTHQDSGKGPVSPPLPSPGGHPLPATSCSIPSI